VYLPSAGVFLVTGTAVFIVIKKLGERSPKVMKAVVGLLVAIIVNESCCGFTGCNYCSVNRDNVCTEYCLEK
jgi:hypothetical protein